MKNTWQKEKEKRGRTVFVASLLFTFSFSLFTYSSALAKKTTGEVFGEVRLNGKIVNNVDPSVVEYQGLCGTKKPINMVNLWKGKVTGLTLWLTARGDTPDAAHDVDTKYVSIEYCDFHPQLTLVRPGDTVRISNNDYETEWLVIKEDGAKKRQVRIGNVEDPFNIKVKKGKTIQLNSAFYPWMYGWIKPVERLSDITIGTSGGKFRFKNVTPGDYTLHAWHPVLGEVEMDITVEADRKHKYDLKYPVPDDSNLPDVKASELEILKKEDGEEKDDDPFK